MLSPEDIGIFICTRIAHLLNLANVWGIWSVPSLSIYVLIPEKQFI